MIQTSFKDDWNIFDVKNAVYSPCTILYCLQTMSKHCKHNSEPVLQIY